MAQAGENGKKTKRRRLAEEENDGSEPEMFEAVLSDEYTNNVQHGGAVVMKISDKRYTSHIVKFLNKEYPVDQWTHLKRVKCSKTANKALYALVCPVDPTLGIQMNIDNTKLALASRAGFNNTWMDDLSVEQIPTLPVLTRSQFDEASKFWPVNFHEDKYVTKMMSDQIFSQAELLSHGRFREMALKAAEHSSVTARIGCIIVNPKSGQVIAASPDLREEHPLHHAVMVAVDLVARGQGAGTYKYTNEHLLSCRDKLESNDGTLPYICTGYDLYTTHEPCSMCSMALVHSRIGRVFYDKPTSYGVLGSLCKLHVQKGLNHHFEVFKIRNTELS